jgi:type I restriction enzyme S subunit
VSAHRVQLGAICEFKYGKSLPASLRQPGPANVYGSNGPVGTHTEKLLDGPAIVIGRKGSYGEIHFSEGPLWPIDTTYYVDQSTTDCDLRWLHYLLKFLPLTTLNKSAAIPGLNREDAYRLIVQVPPLREQRRIAAILDKADALRRKRKRAIELLDSLTQSIFLEMFGDPASNPLRWPQKEICAVCSVVTGNTPPRGDSRNFGSEIEWIKSDNIDPSLPYVTRAREYLSAKGKDIARTAPAGATLVTCIAGSPNSIGNAALTDREVAFNQQINALIPKHIDPIFLRHHISTGKRLIQEASTKGMKGLVSKSRLESVLLICPPIEQQRDFATSAAHAANLSARERVHFEVAESLFSSLQHRAFSGQL